MAYHRYSIFDSGKFEQKDSGLFVPALSKKPEPRRGKCKQKRHDRLSQVPKPAHVC